MRDERIDTPKLTLLRAILARLPEACRYEHSWEYPNEAGMVVRTEDGDRFATYRITVTPVAEHYVTGASQRGDTQMPTVEVVVTGNE